MYNINNINIVHASRDPVDYSKEWSHVVFTFDNGVSKGYLDGGLV